MTSRSICHHDEVTVRTDAERVWRLADDVPRYPEWVGVTLEVVEAPATLDVGAVYVERTKLAGPLTVVSRWTVTQHDDVARVQRHECADEPGPVKGMWLEMSVTPHSAGEAKFALTIGCEVSAGPLTRPLTALFSKKLKAGNAANAKRFAALLESGPADTDQRIG